MAIITGTEADDFLYSDEGSIDQVDGLGGDDRWTGSYSDPVIFQYDGHSGHFSNGTVLTSIERVNYYSTSVADGNSYTISGGNVNIEGGTGRTLLSIDFTGKVLDPAGRNYIHAGFSLSGYPEHRLLVLVTGVEDNVASVNVDDIRLKLTEHDDAYEFGSDNSMDAADLTQTIFIDGGDGEDTLTVKAIGFSYTITHDLFGNYFIAGGRSGDYYFSSLTITNFEHLIIGNQTYDLAPLTPFTFTEGADLAEGTDLDEFLKALGGNDRIYGGGGDDIIDGGAGSDLIDGGDGIDTATYEDATAGVHVSLAVAGYQKTQGAGRDMLAGVENLLGSAFRDVLTGDDAVNVIDGGGENDALAGGGGDDSLTGGEGNDSLDGGAGADTMAGGFGDDKYYVDGLGDRVTEDDPFGGIDQVFASIGYALGDNLENLTLTGSEAIAGKGNALNNAIRGNAGDNLLDGGAGDDTLVGGAGADTFAFTSLSPQGNGDLIKDFVHGADHIALSRAAFTGLAIFGATLDAAELDYGKKALTASDRLIYDEASGVLWYDRDGVGGASQIKIATLSGHPHLDTGDFILL